MHMKLRIQRIKIQQDSNGPTPNRAFEISVCAMTRTLPTRLPLVTLCRTIQTIRPEAANSRSSADTDAFIDQSYQRHRFKVRIESWDGPPCTVLLALYFVSRRTHATHNAVVDIDCVSPPPVVVFDIANPLNDIGVLVYVLSDPLPRMQLRRILAAGLHPLVLDGLMTIQLGAPSKLHAQTGQLPTASVSLEVEELTDLSSTPYDVITPAPFGTLQPHKPNDPVRNDLFVIVETGRFVTEKRIAARIVQLSMCVILDDDTMAPPCLSLGAGTALVTQLTLPTPGPTATPTWGQCVCIQLPVKLLRRAKLRFTAAWFDEQTGLSPIMSSSRPLTDTEGAVLTDGRHFVRDDDNSIVINTKLFSNTASASPAVSSLLNWHHCDIANALSRAMYATPAELQPCSGAVFDQLFGVLDAYGGDTNLSSLVVGVLATTIDACGTTATAHLFSDYCMRPGHYWSFLISAASRAAASPDSAEARAALRVLPHLVRFAIAARAAQLAHDDQEFAGDNDPLCTLLQSLCLSLRALLHSPAPLAVAAQGLTLKQAHSVLLEARAAFGLERAAEECAQLLHVAPCSNRALAHRTVDFARAVMTDAEYLSSPFCRTVLATEIAAVFSKIATQSAADAAVCASAVADMVAAAEQMNEQDDDLMKTLSPLLPVLLMGVEQEQLARAAAVTLIRAVGVTEVVSTVDTTLLLQSLASIADTPCARVPTAALAVATCLLDMVRGCVDRLRSDVVVAHSGWSLLFRVCTALAATVSFPTLSRVTAMSIIEGLWTASRCAVGELLIDILTVMMTPAEPVAVAGARVCVRFIASDADRMYRSLPSACDQLDPMRSSAAIDVLLKELSPMEHELSAIRRFVALLDEIRGILKLRSEIAQIPDGRDFVDDRVRLMLLLQAKLRGMKRTEDAGRVCLQLSDMYLEYGMHAEAASCLLLNSVELSWMAPFGERKEKTYLQAVDMFTKGLAFPKALWILNEIQHGSRRTDVLATVNARRTALQKETSSTSGQLAVFFYLVSFFGAVPADLTDRQYIYRTTERLDAFLAFLRRRYPDAIVSAADADTSDSPQVLRATVTTVIPASVASMESDDVQVDVTYASQLLAKTTTLPSDVHGFSCFGLTRASVRTTAESMDTLQNTWLSITFLQTDQSLPAATRRVAVKRSRSGELAPALYATAIVHAKTLEVEAILASCKAGLTPPSMLAMVLHGAIAAAVSGGPDRLRRAFLEVQSAYSEKHSECELQMLRSALHRQRIVLQDGLTLHGTICTGDQQPMQQQLTGMFAGNDLLMCCCSITGPDASTRRRQVNK
eukprot:TRINITY_DN1399_c0_g1_i1.p1 TRINITY_DN1399_c0_g1~~TRINITY_DN1399_c0_g1_i1.p1  ORF type:complete len:1303 (-),score=260.07 TRINITY_DN1399_c0_g1_i1:3347-7255(-)